MPGNTEQGKKSAATNKAKYGEDFYARIGKVGGKRSKTGGFAWMKLHDPERLKTISQEGGKKTKS